MGNMHNCDIYNERTHKNHMKRCVIVSLSKKYKLLIYLNTFKVTYSILMVMSWYKTTAGFPVYCQY